MTGRTFEHSSLVGEDSHSLGQKRAVLLLDDPGVFGMRPNAGEAFETPARPDRSSGPNLELEAAALRAEKRVGSRSSPRVGIGVAIAISVDVKPSAAASTLRGGTIAKVGPELNNLFGVAVRALDGLCAGRASWHCGLKGATARCTG
jgi:hypothetical protein